MTKPSTVTVSFINPETYRDVETQVLSDTWVIVTPADYAVNYGGFKISQISQGPREPRRFKVKPKGQSYVLHYNSTTGRIYGHVGLPVRSVRLGTPKPGTKLFIELPFNDEHQWFLCEVIRSAALEREATNKKLKKENYAKRRYLEQPTIWDRILDEDKK